MRIAMIGQKGVPATHGGVERHVEELAARLVSLGHEVVVYTRPNYTARDVSNHRGIVLVSLPTIGTKHLDAIAHSLLATIHSWTGRIDVVHYHAIGPCLVSPLARLRGRRVVATIHGQDWRRGKWGGLAAGILRVAEWMALTVPHVTISVSSTLAETYRAEGHEVDYVPNGIAVPEGSDDRILDEFGLAPGGYVLFAGRIVPEKGLHYLVSAYIESLPELPLVVAGDTSGSDDYVRGLRESSPDSIRYVGYQYGERLASLFRNAALFVLPSDLEGLPIVLLEALAFGSPVLASDIPPNKEVLGSKGAYFEAGDVESLKAALHDALERRDLLAAESRKLAGSARMEYDWDSVARQTEALYERALRLGR